MGFEGFEGAIEGLRVLRVLRVCESLKPYTNKYSIVRVYTSYYTDD